MYWCSCPQPGHKRRLVSIFQTSELKESYFQFGQDSRARLFVSRKRIPSTHMTVQIRQPPTPIESMGRDLHNRIQSPGRLPSVPPSASKVEKRGKKKKEKQTIRKKLVFHRLIRQFSQGQRLPSPTSRRQTPHGWSAQGKFSKAAEGKKKSANHVTGNELSLCSAPFLCAKIGQSPERKPSSYWTLQTTRRKVRNTNRGCCISALTFRSRKCVHKEVDFPSHDSTACTLGGAPSKLSNRATIGNHTRRVLFLRRRKVGATHAAQHVSSHKTEPTPLDDKTSGVYS